MSASISTKIIRDGAPFGPVMVDQSRDDVRKGDKIICEAADPGGHSTFTWSLVFTPDHPNGDDSSSGLINPPGKTETHCEFMIDAEGAYLIQLVVGNADGTTETRFIRVRYVTKFSSVKLVAAGERRDAAGVIPFDLSPEGWTNDQNRNLQTILAHTRRVATSGRVLFVDSNKGRRAYDKDQEQNDYNQIIELPGSDTSNSPESLSRSGIHTEAEGFGDFCDINAAITYAMDAGDITQPHRANEQKVSEEAPYYIFIQPGLYIEDLVLRPNIHLIGLGGDHLQGSVVVRTTNASGGHVFHSPDTISGQCRVMGIHFENKDISVNGVPNENPVLTVKQGWLNLIECYVHQTAGNGVAIYGSSKDTHRIHLERCRVKASNQKTTAWALYLDGPGSTYQIDDSYINGWGGAILLNPSLHGQDDSCGPAKDLVTLYAKETLLRGRVGPAINTNAYHTRMRGCLIDTAEMAGGVPAAIVVHGGDPAPLTQCGITFKLEHVQCKEWDGPEDDITLYFNAKNVGGHGPHLEVSACEHLVYDFPVAPLGSGWELDAEGNPLNYTVGTGSKSIAYDREHADPFTGVDPVLPPPQQLGAMNVQDAIDDLVAISAPIGAHGEYHSLDTAYDAFQSINPPIKGAGHGRIIVADSGPVEILGYDFATDPAHTDNGSLWVSNQVRVGPSNKPEIILNSNTYGAGPVMAMGHDTWPSDIVNGPGRRSLPAGKILGRTKVGHNFGLHLQTQSSKHFANGSVGWLVLRAGDSLDTGSPGAHDAGSIHIRAGDYLNENQSDSMCPSGYVWVKPGTSNNHPADKHGTVRLVGPGGGHSAAVLTAGAAPKVGADLVVSGVLHFTTDMGPVEVRITPPLATLDDWLDAFNKAPAGPQSSGCIKGLGRLHASDNGAGKIKLTSATTGMTAEILYLHDHNDGGIPDRLCQQAGNLSLHPLDLAGEMVGSGFYSAGAYGDWVDLACSDDQEITIGSGANDLIYNAITGKLTVPGMIDPTGLVFDEVASDLVVEEISNDKGALFISDGTGMLSKNHLYYVDENGVFTDISMGGGVSPAGGGASKLITVWHDATSVTGHPGFLWDDVHGRLGVGVAAPLSSIHASGGITLGDEAHDEPGTIKWDGSDFLGFKDGAWTSLTHSASGGDFSDGGEVTDHDRTLGNQNAWALGFLTSNIQRIHIQADGLVSIGHLTPCEQLDVAGAIKIQEALEEKEGTVQWDGSEFLGHDGDKWINLGIGDTWKSCLHGVLGDVSVGGSGGAKFVKWGDISDPGFAGSLVIPYDSNLVGISINYVGATPLEIAAAGHMLTFEVGLMAKGEPALAENFTPFDPAIVPIIQWTHLDSHTYDPAPAHNGYPQTFITIDPGQKLNPGDQIAVRCVETGDVLAGVANDSEVTVSLWVDGVGDGVAGTSVSGGPPGGLLGDVQWNDGTGGFAGSFRFHHEGGSVKLGMVDWSTEEAAAARADSTLQVQVDLDREIHGTFNAAAGSNTINGVLAECDKDLRIGQKARFASGGSFIVVGLTETTITTADPLPIAYADAKILAPDSEIQTWYDEYTNAVASLSNDGTLTASRLVGTLAPQMINAEGFVVDPGAPEILLREHPQAVYVGIDTGVAGYAGVTVYLPNRPEEGAINGRIFHVKDEGGAVGNGTPITVRVEPTSAMEPTAGQIDKEDSVVIDTPLESLMFLCRGLDADGNAKWFIV